MSRTKTIKKTVDDVFRSTLSLLDKGKTIVFRNNYATGAVQDTFDAVRSGSDKGWNTISADGLAKPMGGLGWNDELVGMVTGRAGLVGNLGMGALLITSLPGAYDSARKSFRAAVKTKSREDVVTAIHAGTALGRSSAYSMTKSVNLLATASLFYASYQSAAEAFRLASPLVSSSLAHEAAVAASKATYEGLSATAMQIAVLQSTGGASIEAAQAATTAAVNAHAAAGQGLLGSVASWLAPGVNIAVMVFDLGVAAATLADVKASTGRKVTSCITAAASMVAASNIPVVSQAGAAVAFGSSLVGYFL